MMTVEMFCTKGYHCWITYFRSVDVLWQQFDEDGVQVELCNDHDPVGRKLENHTGDLIIVGRDQNCISYDYSDTPGER
eukprot:755856-Hanusia_phi.AAC.1